LLVGIVLALSLVVVPPGQTRVVLFFGRYVGSLRTPGSTLLAPLTTRKAVSVRVRNFETNRLKVNDSDGNPVDIAAIVVWQVADTARSTYAVDNYQDFVTVQAESVRRRAEDPLETRCGVPVGVQRAGELEHEPDGERIGLAEVQLGRRLEDLVCQGALV
jgi:regulator of protease activity HflC (stomatin/prohibitin superfamily)